MQPLYFERQNEIILKNFLAINYRMISSTYMVLKLSSNKSRNLCAKLSKAWNFHVKHSCGDHENI